MTAAAIQLTGTSIHANAATAIHGMVRNAFLNAARQRQHSRAMILQAISRGRKGLTPPILGEVPAHIATI